LPCAEDLSFLCPAFEIHPSSGHPSGHFLNENRCPPTMLHEFCFCRPQPSLSPSLLIYVLKDSVSCNLSFPYPRTMSSRGFSLFQLRFAGSVDLCSLPLLPDPEPPRRCAFFILPSFRSNPVLPLSSDSTLFLPFRFSACLFFLPRAGRYFLFSFLCTYFFFFFFAFMVIDSFPPMHTFVVMCTPSFCRSGRPSLFLLALVSTLCPILHAHLYSHGLSTYAQAHSPVSLCSWLSHPLFLMSLIASRGVFSSPSPPRAGHPYVLLHLRFPA